MKGRSLRAIPVIGVMSILWAGVATAQPAVSVSSISVPEPGGLGTNVATFTLQSGNKTASQTVIVSTTSPASGPVATPAIPGGGCGPNVDYLPIANVAVTLGAGASQTVTVPLCGDNMDELDESFALRVNRPDGTSLPTGEIRATIVDDDPPPALKINNVEVDESAAGSTHLASFEISLTTPSGKGVSFTWATAASPSGRPATVGTCGAGGADYVAVPPTQATIPAGTGSLTRAVVICGDGVFEDGEHLAVMLSNATNATIQDNMGIASIIDDEPRPQVALSQTVPIVAALSATMSEARFTVTRTGVPIERPLDFNYGTENGTMTGSNSCLDMRLGNISKPGGDYITKSGTETFQPSETTKVITVAVCKLNAKSGETFRLRIWGSQVNVTQATATGTMP